ncbi:MAG: carbohydrate binding family 9 domain-containing protein [Flammeovirgaceae bacterium]|nr:carbohydrate binding family 9 domain-containing protein [Flammeovirgaceae bacterium]
MKFLACVLILSISVSLAKAQNDSIKSYTTAPVVGEPPIIDGKLDDAAWELVPWGGGDFKEREPDAGTEPSAQTKFKILYDAKSLYLLFRCLDPEPDKIVRRMSRRDGFDGDFVEINIDSYYDKRTAFSFTSSVSGVKGDEYVSNNGDNWDASWDPIWYLQTSIDAEGWIAELRIPLSQLRFAGKPEHVWGIQVMRHFFRNKERSNWQYIPPGSPGWVHLFGELRGIKGIKPQKQLEIQPYVVAKAETFQEQENNPYATGSSTGLDVGLDAKIGLTSDITLDLTVNPDFGQVEADPSQVNLTAFELFFREQRPFFIEGNNTLNFPVTQNSDNNLFYSRRVGRKPQGRVNVDEQTDSVEHEYVKPISRTTILGAAKLTGKNRSGFSWGILESITSREFAEVDSLGADGNHYKRKQLIEPLTNYFVARAQQDIHKGNTVVGAMFTAANREKANVSGLDLLHREAYSGGVDLLHNFYNRKFYISGRGVVSQVKGSREAISRTQTSSVRYFQRPNNKHTTFDSTRTSLTGTGGQLMVGKRSGRLIGDLAFVWQSPELELNDLGFMSQTDYYSQWFWMQYRVLNPKGITRSQRYNINQWIDHDFGGRNLNEGYNVNMHWEFKNFWQAGTGFTYNVRSASNADLRGGPSIKYPGSDYYWMYVNSDSRKKFYVSINPEFGFGHQNYSRSMYIGMSFTYRPINALNLSVSPSFNGNKYELQYVGTSPTDENEDKYVMAEIDQSTVRVVLRATFMVTPNLSIQYYGQPFGTKGNYSDFKFVTDANASELKNRFQKIEDAWLTLNNGEYQVDDDGDTNTDYRFYNPNFNFGQFRSNMVVRWEYIPGSTLFLVWTRERNGDFKGPGGNVIDRYFDFNEKGYNVFLIKFTYRFVL